MAKQANKQTDDCGCVGKRKLASLTREIEQLKIAVSDLFKELQTIRRAVRK